MSKILISWYAYNHDFAMEQRGALKRKLEKVNVEGPTFHLHKYFGNQYERHVLLNSSNNKEDEKHFNMLLSELKKEFKHKIETRHIPLINPADIVEVFEKINSLLLEFNHFEVEVCVSPGTPQMQFAWYLVKPNFKKNVTLFQLREAKFTKEKNKPEKIEINIESIFNPGAIYIANKESTKQPIENKILITETIKPVYAKAEQIAKTNNVGCLILGENGTGKENLAFHIHINSSRHKESDKKFEKFKAINCAAYSEELLRSELFGYEKGSFTGANKLKIGLFEEASGGTIFLDEIGDILPKMQVSLLRVLQEKKIQRVGGTIEIPIDVRIIAATNQPLEQMCEEGKFRWDLFFRLAIAPLKLPPLRDWTKKEIKDLIEHFNNIYFEEFPNRKEKLKFSKEVIDRLTNYHFKGNVRELQNLILSLYTFCDKEVTLADLPERMKKEHTHPLSKEENEKEHIKKVLESKKGNIKQTAETLGMTRDTLRRKMLKYELPTKKDN